MPKPFKLNTIFLKSLSWLTILLFSWNTVAWSIPANTFPRLTKDISSREPAKLFRIPSSLGTIEEEIMTAHDSPESPVIIHIQDAHANYESQIKTEKILNFLAKDYGISLIFLEGAQTQVDPKLFHFFEDHSRNLAMADYLMRQGEFSGAEMSLLERSKIHNPGSRLQEIKAYGVEDEDAYRKDLLTFRRVFTGRSEGDRFIREMDSRIQRLASSMWSLSLQRFAKKWRAFHKNKLTLLSFIRILGQNSKRELGIDLSDPVSQLDYPHLVRIFKLEEMEPKLDLEQFEREKEALLAYFNKANLKPSLIEAFKKKVTPLSSKNREAKRNLRGLFEEIYRAIPGPNFSFKNFPQVSLWGGTLVLREELESKELMDEVRGLSNKLFGHFAKDKNAKRLLKLFRDALLLERLFHLELTRKEYEKLERCKERLQPLEFLARIKKLEAQSKNFQSFKEEPNESEAQELFFEARSFYEQAKKREKIMIENTLRLMKENKKTKAILVTGGFHTEGLREELINKNVGYVEVTPRLSAEEKNGGYYLRSILGRNFSTDHLKSPLYEISFAAQERLGVSLGERHEFIQEAYLEIAARPRHSNLKASAQSKPVELGMSKSSPIERRHSERKQVWASALKLLRAGIESPANLGGAMVAIARRQRVLKTKPFEAKSLGSSKARSPVDATDWVKKLDEFVKKHRLENYPGYRTEIITDLDKESGRFEGEKRYRSYAAIVLRGMEEPVRSKRMWADTAGRAEQLAARSLLKTLIRQENSLPKPAEHPEFPIPIYGEEFTAALEELASGLRWFEPNSHEAADPSGRWKFKVSVRVPGKDEPLESDIITDRANVEVGFIRRHMDHYDRASRNLLLKIVRAFPILGERVWILSRPNGEPNYQRALERWADQNHYDMKFHLSENLAGDKDRPWVGRVELTRPGSETLSSVNVEGIRTEIAPRARKDLVERVLGLKPLAAEFPGIQDPQVLQKIWSPGRKLVKHTAREEKKEESESPAAKSPLSWKEKLDRFVKKNHLANRVGFQVTQIEARHGAKFFPWRPEHFIEVSAGIIFGKGKILRSLYYTDEIENREAAEESAAYDLLKKLQELKSQNPRAFRAFKAPYFPLPIEGDDFYSALNELAYRLGLKKPHYLKTIDHRGRAIETEAVWQLRFRRKGKFSEITVHGFGYGNDRNSAAKNLLLGMEKAFKNDFFEFKDRARRRKDWMGRKRGGDIDYDWTLEHWRENHHSKKVFVGSPESIVQELGIQPSAFVPESTDVLRKGHAKPAKITSIPVGVPLELSPILIGEGPLRAATDADLKHGDRIDVKTLPESDQAFFEYARDRHRPFLAWLGGGPRSRFLDRPVADRDVQGIVKKLTRGERRALKELSSSSDPKEARLLIKPRFKTVLRFRDKIRYVYERFHLSLKQPTDVHPALADWGFFEHAGDLLPVQHAFGIAVTADGKLWLSKPELTINLTAFAAGKDGNLVFLDPSGGRKDLKNKVARFAGPLNRFGIDTLLRSFRFKHAFGLTWDPSALEILKIVSSQLEKRLQKDHPIKNEKERKRSLEVWGRMLEDLFRDAPDPIAAYRELKQFGFINSLIALEVNVEAIFNRELNARFIKQYGEKRFDGQIRKTEHGGEIFGIPTPIGKRVRVTIENLKDILEDEYPDYELVKGFGNVAYEFEDGLVSKTVALRLTIKLQEIDPERGSPRLRRKPAAMSQLEWLETLRMEEEEQMRKQEEPTAAFPEPSLHQMEVEQIFYWDPDQKKYIDQEDYLSSREGKSSDAQGQSLGSEKTHLSQPYHFRVDSTVQSYEGDFLSYSERDSQYKPRRAERPVRQVKPEDEDYQKHVSRVAKFRNAVDYLKAKAETLSDPKLRDEMLARAERIGTTTTVIGLHMDTQLFFYDAGDKPMEAYQSHSRIGVYHIGRRRSVIYFSNLFLDSLPNSPESIEELALYLDRAERWIDDFQRLTHEATEEELDPDKIYDLMRETRKNFAEEDAQVLQEPSHLNQILQRLAAVASEDEKIRQKVIPGRIKERVHEIRALEDELMQKTAEKTNLPTRDDYVNLAELYGNLGHLQDSIGQRSDAIISYKAQVDALHDAQIAEKVGRLPFQTQEDIVRILLRIGLYDRFLHELEILLKGEGLVYDAQKGYRRRYHPLEKDLLAREIMDLGKYFEAELLYIFRSQQEELPLDIREKVKNIPKIVKKLFAETRTAIQARTWGIGGEESNWSLPEIQEGKKNYVIEHDPDETFAWLKVRVVDREKKIFEIAGQRFDRSLPKTDPLSTMVRRIRDHMKSGKQAGLLGIMYDSSGKPIGITEDQGTIFIRLDHKKAYVIEFSDTFWLEWDFTSGEIHGSPMLETLYKDRGGKKRREEDKEFISSLVKFVEKLIAADQAQKTSPPAGHSLGSAARGASLGSLEEQGGRLQEVFGALGRLRKAKDDKQRLDLLEFILQNGKISRALRLYFNGDRFFEEFKEWLNRNWETFVEAVKISGRTRILRDLLEFNFQYLNSQDLTEHIHEALEQIRRPNRSGDQNGNSETEEQVFENFGIVLSQKPASVDKARRVREDILHWQWKLSADQGRKLKDIELEKLVGRREILNRLFAESNPAANLYFNPLDHPELLMLPMDSKRVATIRRAIREGRFEAQLRDEVLKFVGVNIQEPLVRKLDDPYGYRFWADREQEINTERELRKNEGRANKAQVAEIKKQSELALRGEWKAFRKDLRRYILRESGSSEETILRERLQGRKVIIPSSVIHIEQRTGPWVGKRAWGVIHLFRQSKKSYAYLNSVAFARKNTFFEAAVKINERGEVALKVREVGKSYFRFDYAWNGANFIDMSNNKVQVPLYRDWFLFGRGNMPARPMQKRLILSTVDQSAFASLFEVVKDGKTAALVIHKDYWRDEKGRVRSLWFPAGIHQGKKTITVHLRPDGPPLGRATWNPEEENFDHYEGPVFSRHADRMRRRFEEWVRNDLETSRIEGDLPLTRRERGKRSVSLFPERGGQARGVVYSQEFVGHKTVHVTTVSLEGEKRFEFTVSTRDGLSRKKVTRYHDSKTDSLLKPNEELMRRFKLWAQLQSLKRAPRSLLGIIRNTGSLYLSDTGSKGPVTIFFGASGIRSGRKVFVTFRDQSTNGKIMKVVKVYGINKTLDSLERPIEFLWAGFYDKKKGEMVLFKNFTPHRLISEERYRIQLEAWRLEYSPRPDSPDITKEETAYLILQELSETPRSSKEFSRLIEERGFSSKYVSKVWKDLQTKNNPYAAEIVSVGSGRFSKLEHVQINQENHFTYGGRSFRLPLSKNLQGKEAQVAFQNGRPLKVILRDGTEISFKRVWSLDGMLIPSPAIVKRHDQPSFIFGNLVAGEDETVRIWTREGVIRIPAKAGEVVSGVVINDQLIRVDWFPSGSEIHQVYKTEQLAEDKKALLQDGVYSMRSAVALPGMVLDSNRLQTLVQSAQSLGKDSIKKVLQTVGWTGAVIGTAVVLALQPSVLISFLPLMLEGWWLIAVGLFASRFQKQYFKQFSIALAGIAVSFVGFHLALNGFQSMPDVWDIKNSIAIRFASVFTGVMVSKMLFPSKQKETFREKAFSSFRWALSFAVITGYFIYYVFFPFLQANISSPLLKAAFHMGPANWLAVTHLMIITGAAFGEDKNVLADVSRFKNFFRSKTFQTFITLYPINFLFWSPAIWFIWFVSPDTVTVRWVHGSLHFLWVGIFSTIIRRFFSSEEKGENASVVAPQSLEQEARGASLGEQFVTSENRWLRQGSPNIHSAVTLDDIQRDRNRTLKSYRLRGASLGNEPMSDREKLKRIEELDKAILKETQTLINQVPKLPQSLRFRLNRSTVNLQDNLSKFKHIPLSSLLDFNRAMEQAEIPVVIFRTKLKGRLVPLKERLGQLLDKKRELDRLLKETENVAIGRLSPQDLLLRKRDDRILDATVLALRLAKIAEDLPTAYVNLYERLREISKGTRDWSLNPDDYTKKKSSAYVAALESISRVSKDRNEVHAQKLRALADQFGLLVEQSRPIQLEFNFGEDTGAPQGQSLGDKAKGLPPMFEDLKQDIQTLEVNPDVVDRFAPQISLLVQTMMENGMPTRLYGGAVLALAHAVYFDKSLPIDDIDFTVPSSYFETGIWQTVENSYKAKIDQKKLDYIKPSPSEQEFLQGIIRTHLEWSVSKFWLEYDPVKGKYLLKGFASSFHDLQAKTLRLTDHETDLHYLQRRFTKIVHKAETYSRFGFSIDQQSLTKFEDRLKALGPSEFIMGQLNYLRTFTTQANSLGREVKLKSERLVNQDVTRGVARIYYPKTTRREKLVQLGLIQDSPTATFLLHSLPDSMRPLFEESEEFGVAVVSTRALSNVRSMENVLLSHPNKMLIVFVEGPVEEKVLVSENQKYSQRLEGRIQLAKSDHAIIDYSTFLNYLTRGGPLADQIRQRANLFYRRSGRDGKLSQNEFLKFLTVVAEKESFDRLSLPFLTPFYSNQLALDYEAQQFAEMFYAVIGSGISQADLLKQKVGDNLEIKFRRDYRIESLALNRNALAHHLELLGAVRSSQEILAHAV